MKIISFGITKDITGSLFIDFDAGKNLLSIAELKENLFKKYPGLKELKTLSIAVNNAYASNETMVSSRDEVALIPPVSGG
jgi:molybdopterin converting factor small subunit